MEREKVRKQLGFDAFVQGEKPEIATLPSDTIFMTLYYLSTSGKKVCNNMHPRK